MASKESGTPSVWVKGSPIIPNAPFTSCPIATSLGVLGKKWTMLVLRDIAMRKMERFSELQKSVSGITPRMLSTRLRELEGAGMIDKRRNKESPGMVRWSVTEKGWDALPILMSYTAFGSKWLAPLVFEDAEPREMREIYPQRNLRNKYVNIEFDKNRIKRLQKLNGKSLGSWSR